MRHADKQTFISKCEWINFQSVKFKKPNILLPIIVTTLINLICQLVKIRLK